MRCSGCGFDNTEGTKFCGECGTPLASGCRHCGAENPPGFKFCGQCGQALTPGPAIADASRNRARPGKKPTVQAAEAERRQLTVMFCDLVGSTALSQRLDPEDMREVIRAYQDTCAGVITGFEGFVAKFMGDGVLAYFGYPRAHEDDAERAVRAGLALVEAVGELAAPAGEPLATRIGIATGLVVVGDLIGEGASAEETVVGDTPNLAARLQALATPDAVVIAPATRRLLGGLFECEDLGDQALKGISEPVQAWRVIRAREADSRFEASRVGRLTPLVGREEELDMLVRRWRRAKAGDGQVVLISAEPGIGKSRLTQALRESIAAEPYIRVRYQCSPYFTNSALHPVIDQLERAAGFARDDTPEGKLDRLERMLARATNGGDKVAPLFAELLSVPTDRRYPALDLSPEQRKERTLAALIAQMEGLAARQPLFVVFEDVHWMDPTTLDLLDRVVERVQAIPVLVIVTFRPEFVPSWTGQAHVTLLALSRMDRRQCAVMVEKVTGGKALPDEVLGQIVAKTDGVPLFVEELTKTVLESGLLVEEADRYVLTGPLPPLAIPATLHDSLMARLDQLAPVKEVAQAGACIGREFSYELLAEISPLPGIELTSALDQLAAAELVYRRGTPPDAIYSFKHALVQDAAYASLLRSRRQQIHARITDVLEQRFPATAPETLAHHAAEAGFAEKAVNYWWQAAQAATARSAIKEAVAQLESGLELLATLPASEDNARLELDMQLALGNACMAARGWASPQTVAAFERARALCDELGDTERRIVADNGMYIIYLLSGRLDAGLALSKDLWRRAENGLFPPILAHRSLAANLFHCGRLSEARAHLESGLALYDPGQHADFAYRFGYDPQVTLLGYLAISLHYLGHAELALNAHADLIDLLPTHPHLPSRTFALFQACWLRALNGQVLTDPTLLEQLIEVCEEHGFPNWHALAIAQKGWVTARSGDLEAGEELLVKGLALWRGTGSRLVIPYYLGLIAEVLALQSRWQEAEDHVLQGLETIAETGDQVYAPGLLRLWGQMSPDTMDRTGEPHASRLRRAIELAREQDARLEELRASTCLARILAERGERRQAVNLLAPIYGWFTEGLDTADLKAAKALLDELG
jgi:class 3 adenylate cyclase/predicted ATPase